MNDPKRPTPADAFRSAAKSADKTGEALKELGKHLDKKSEPKKPYVRPEHLMHRPFRDNPALREMQDKLRIQEGRRNRNPKAKRQR